MARCVDVRVINVDESEINALESLISSRRSTNEWESDIDRPEGQKDFVVTVRTGELHELKDALRAVLKVVKAERIAIEP